MNETETQVEAPKNGESAKFGVSVRGWLSLIVFTTACVMSVMGQEVGEPLYGLVMVCAGFYFGQKTK